MPEFREDIIVYKHDVECEEINGMTLVDRDVYGPSYTITIRLDYELLARCITS